MFKYIPVVIRHFEEFLSDIPEYFVSGNRIKLLFVGSKHV